MIMCFSTPKAPPNLPPPPAAPPTATVLGAAVDKNKKKRAGTELESLRVPLNPTGLPQTPRLGL